MTRSVRDTLGVAIQPALRVWDRIPMRAQGRITVMLPLVAVIVSACLAASGNYQRVAIETDIQRKFEMSAALGDLTSLMINAETGMRGYLLTNQTEFLEPFDQASRSLPSSMDRLTALAAAEPGEKPRTEKLGQVQDLRVLTGQQMADLAFQRGSVSSGRTVADPEIRGHLAYGKTLMDRIRTEVGGMQAAERRLLDERISDINSIRLRDYLSVIVALVAALATRFLAWYLFRKGTLRRVERLTESLRCRRTGSPPPVPLPEKNDHMGELEREVNLLGR